MDLDEFDEFDMDDMARIPRKPDRPSRPRSQMFEEPLHIENDDDSQRGSVAFDSGFDNDFNFQDGALSTASLPPLDSVPGDTDNFSASGLGGRAPPVSQQAPVFVASDSGGFSVGGGSNKVTTCIACCLFFILLACLAGLLVLSVVILVVVLDIRHDVNNLELKFQTPTADAILPQQVGGT